MAEDKTTEIAKIDEKKPQTQVTDAQKEEMFKKFCGGRSLKDIATDFGLHYQTVAKYAQVGNWKERREKELIVLQEIKDMTIEAKGKATVDSLANTALIMARGIEESVAEGNPLAAIQLKELTNAIDKLQRLHFFTKAGGVDKSEVTKKVQTIDWNEMAKLYLKAKKENLEYDAEQHVKDVLNIEAKEVNGK